MIRLVVLESYVTKARDAAMSERGNRQNQEVGRWANNRVIVPIHGDA